MLLDIMRCKKGILLSSTLGFLAFIILQSGTLTFKLSPIWLTEEVNTADGSGTQIFDQEMAPVDQKVSQTTRTTSKSRESSATAMSSAAINTTTIKTTLASSTPITTKATVPSTTTTTKKAPLLPDIKVDPDEKWVILHTYMRGGSTFLGTMFERNPKAFYMFEPLFPIYHGMLGVPNTMHPLRVYTTKNGTWRTFSEEEERYLAKALLNMFTCNFKELRPETLASNYMDFNHIYNYTTCMISQSYNYYQCIKPVTQICPSQLDTAFENNCHLYMAKIHNDTSSFLGMDKLNSTSLAKFPSIVNYTNCMNKMWTKIPKCLPKLEVPCRRSKLKIFKMIRGNVALIKRMMEVNPNTYVIHQVRDPRGMVLSRKTTVNLSFDMEKEGKMLCKKIRKDFQEIMKLYELYPTKFKHIRYEDMAQDVLGTAHSIYMFLGEEMPSIVTKHLQGTTNSKKNAGPYATERKNSTQTAFAWRSKISKKLKLVMDSECQDILKYLHYDI